MPAFSIENIVSITFTKKAAGELKARLMKLLQELEVQSGGHVKKWWAQQIEKLEDAPIGTIDSFFGSILRENALLDDSEDRIEPDFELMDPYDALELQGIAVQLVLERTIATKRSGASLAIINPTMAPMEKPIGMMGPSTFFRTSCAKASMLWDWVMAA
jgi:ATP-dependent exoDNAse (exonuclease V) beta subunit